MCRGILSIRTIRPVRGLMDLPRGLAQNYGVIRFTVPGQGGGTYQVGSLVRAYLNGPLSGDCDFHVVRNGTELFVAFLPGNGGTNYANNLTLAAGDTIDFVVGRGTDGNNYGSGLNIKAAINLIDTNPVAPTILTQPQSQTVT